MMAQQITKRPWSVEEKRMATEYWKIGWSAGQIAKVLGRTRDSIKSKGARCGLSLKQKDKTDRREKRLVPVANRLDKNSIPEPNSGCLLWLGAVCSKGYGSLRLKGRTYSTHRLAYENSKGQIPEGMF